MEEGLSPDAFWKQTPRTFVVVMEGRARAAQRQFEAGLAQAWHTEAFAREKRLKPLSKYLAATKPQKPQSTGDMLAALRELSARGAPMTIRRVQA